MEIIKIQNNFIGVIVPKESSEFTIIHGSTRLARFFPIYSRYQIPKNSYEIIGEYEQKEFFSYSNITDVNIVKHIESKNINLNDEKIIILRILKDIKSNTFSSCCNSYIYTNPTKVGKYIEKQPNEFFCFKCKSRIIN